MATRKIVPRADNEGGIGTALKRWASAFIAAITVNTIALLGGQIAFPATQAPSSNPNTLDDYVEGTWEFIATGSTSGSNSIGTGSYIKIGALVAFCVAGNFGATPNAMVGNLLLSLPFTPGAGEYKYSHLTDITNSGGVIGAIPNYIGHISVDHGKASLITPNGTVYFSATSGTFANKVFQMSGFYFMI